MFLHGISSILSVKSYWEILKIPKIVMGIAFIYLIDKRLSKSYENK